MENSNVVKNESFWIVSLVVVLFCLGVYTASLRHDYNSLNGKFDYLFSMLRKEQEQNKVIKERQINIEKQKTEYYKNKNK